MHTHLQQPPGPLMQACALRERLLLPRAAAHSLWDTVASALTIQEMVPTLADASTVL